MAATHRIPTLPVITPSNRRAYPRWHAYFERVYGEPVSVPFVDLNTFTWFYWSAPFDVAIEPRTQLGLGLGLGLGAEDAKRGHEVSYWLGDTSLAHTPERTNREAGCVQRRSQLRLRPHDAFRGRFPTVKQANVSLMRALSLYGFFVHRQGGDGVRLAERVEVIRVYDNWRKYGVWYWCVEGSGVFLQLSEFLNGTPSLDVRSRFELPPFHALRNVRDKAVIDKCDDQIPAYLREHSYGALLIREAHGVPELVVVDNHPRVHSAHTRDGFAARANRYPEPYGTDISTDRQGRMRRGIRRVSNHVHIDSVSGVNTAFITTGYQRAIRGGSVNETSRLLHYHVDQRRAPPWYTPIQAQLVDVFVRERSHDRLPRLREFAERNARSAVTRTLNTWMPVHVRLYHASGSATSPGTSQAYDIDTVCTPFALAALLGDQAVCRWMHQCGARLTTRCPRAFLGTNDDPGTTDVVAFLSATLTSVQRSSVAVGAIVRALWACASPLERTRLHTVFATELRPPVPGRGPSTHSHRKRPSGTHGHTIKRSRVHRPSRPA